MINELIPEFKYLSESINLSNLKNKRLLITGASGLIGSYLLNFFHYLNANHQQNIKIYALSLHGTYLSAPKNSQHITFMDGDLTDASFLKSIPEVDFVIHAAGYGQPKKFMNQPLKTLGLNANTTEQLLLKSKENFLFFSSSEIYSGLKGGNYKEIDVGTTNTDHPRAAYIEGKRYGECASLLANSNLGITANVARVSLAYGPGPRFQDERVMSQFIVKAFNNAKIEMLDAGQSIRTYAYIRDVVLQLLSIIIAGKGEIYNVGGISKVTILELAQMISDKTRTTLIKKEKSDIFDTSPKEVNIDLTKISEICTNLEFISLDVGVTKTINWFQKLKDCNLTD
jgi:nucleoside-diphosphate-sugar epimerase